MTQGRLQTGPLPHLRRLWLQPVLPLPCACLSVCDGAAQGGSEQSRESSIMSHSHQPDLAELPLFRFAIQSERDLEDALDAWLADDQIDEGRLHVLSWSDDEEVER